MSETTQDIERDSDGGDLKHWLQQVRRMPMGRWFKIEQRYDLEMTTILGMTGRMVVLAANEKQRATSQMDDFDHLESLSLKELEDLFRPEPPVVSDQEEPAAEEAATEPQFPAGAVAPVAEVPGLGQPSADGAGAGGDPAPGPGVPGAADHA